VLSRNLMNEQALAQFGGGGAIAPKTKKLQNRIPCR
jgi:hypothetical protein